MSIGFWLWVRLTTASSFGMRERDRWGGEFKVPTPKPDGGHPATGLYDGYDPGYLGNFLNLSSPQFAQQLMRGSLELRCRSRGHNRRVIVLPCGSL